MIATSLRTILLKDFDDPRLSGQAWANLLAQGETNTVNMTQPWLRNWWHHWGRGRLLLISAERDQETVCLAPLFVDGNMIFNLCPEDCLDFIGRTTDPEIIEQLLRTARGLVPDFKGFKLYFLREDSATATHLPEIAAGLNLVAHEEESIPSPFLDLAGQPEWAVACTRKKSLLRHERALLKEGCLQVHHFRSSQDILPLLDRFFDQHVQRRAATTQASLFSDPAQRDYYRAQTRALGPLGWLRFTRLDFNGQPIAYHYGLCYHGRFLFGIPSFDIHLAHRSPGEVLLRQLLLAALEEGATLFDFGVGAEPYKDRFASGVTRLRNWGLYPK